MVFCCFCVPLRKTYCMRYILFAFILISSILYVSGKNNAALEKELWEYIASVDARVGVAVITHSGDTLSVNGSESFPMLSVYKFPQALAVAEFCNKRGVGFSDTVKIDRSEILPDTYSPLREKYGIVDLELPVSELPAYSLQQSDNNACDILFRIISGTGYADGFIRRLGFAGINMLYTEAETHEDVNLCYMNSATPLDMVRLVSMFCGLRNKTPEYRYIAALMENCATGTDRLAAPLSASDIIGHKTGTGDRNSTGRIIGVNDVGYIRCAGGTEYCIAVFVADSAYSLKDASAIIAEISSLVLKHINIK